MKILLAIPTRGRIHPQTVISVIDILKQTKNVDVFFGWTGRGVEEARNHIAKYFLSTDADYLLTIDDDVYLENNPLDLIECDKDIIGLPYPVILPNGIQIATYKDGKSYKGKGLEQIDELGFGCVLIKRKVLEALRDNPFTAERNHDGTWAISEDRAFCRKAKAKGFEVWAHYDYMAHHYTDIDLTKFYKK